MATDIYSRPIALALVATAVILIGTLAMVFIPIASESMHPVMEGLKPFTPLQLAGRDIYQREGCVNCHTQTVRPLKAEVMRYGEYSKAGEFAYDRPFLWGSKRTGPDLARVGLRYPKAAHYKHFENPQSTAPGTNMPAYAWLKDAQVDAAATLAHMDALSLAYSDEERAELDGASEMDALVAYMLSLGHAVKKTPSAAEGAEMSAGAMLYADNCAGCHGAEREGGFGPALAGTELSEADLKGITMKGTEGGMPPFEGQLTGEQMDSIADFLSGGADHAPAVNPYAILFMDNCAGCHDANGTGGYGPSLVDNTWLGAEGPIDDAKLAEIITKGTEGGMPPFEGTFSDEDLMGLIGHIRYLAQ